MKTSNAAKSRQRKKELWVLGIELRGIAIHVCTLQKNFRGLVRLRLTFAFHSGSFTPSRKCSRTWLELICLLIPGVTGGMTLGDDGIFFP